MGTFSSLFWSGFVSENKRYNARKIVDWDFILKWYRNNIFEGLYFSLF
jgi:hypothetical protein